MRYTAYEMVEYYKKHTSAESLARLSGAQYQDVWVHTNAVHDLADITEAFQLDPNIIHDVRDQRELARVETNATGSYIFLRSIDKEHDGHAVTSPVLAIIKPHVFITIAPHGTFTPAKMQTPLSGTTSQRSEMLLATILEIIGQYEKKIHEIGEKVITIRNRLKTHEVNNDDFVMFVSIEDNLNQYRQNLDGMLAVMRRLSENRAGVFSAAGVETVEDIILHIGQLMVAIKSHTYTVGSIQNAYSTIANNRLNHRMKALTFFTVLLALPNVFYGMYGMNVALPFQNEPWAYFAVVGFTGFLIIVIYTVAKRLRLF